MGRRTPLITGEYYHIFNRGVDKRQVFMDTKDQDRFLESMIEFNTVEPIGSLYLNTFRERQLKSAMTQSETLVDIVAYCINPNHYHFILHQTTEDGISRFLQRIGTGYTKYFNERYKRNGSLFQGSFKSVHIQDNRQLLHVSVYVNLNDRVHDSSTWSLPARSSWKEYVSDDASGMCKKDIVLSQFNDRTKYREFAEDAVLGIISRRKSKEEEDETLNDILRS